MSTTLWNKCQYGKCFGHWLVSDAECAKCALSDKCEKRTKTKVDEQEKCLDAVDTNDSAEQAVTPLDYLLKSLSGRFDYEIDEKEKAVLHKYSQGGKLVIAVVVGSFGKIKIVSVSKNTQKIYGAISSVDEAEEILKEML